jgi:hypothetical protein
MNAETLKQIIDLLATLGVQGKEAFVWYLMVDKVLPALLWFGVAVGLFFVAQQIIRACNNDDKKLREIRDTLRVGAPGFYSEEEHRAVVRRIRELLEQERKA